jgi:outer membrane biosynthesis protein TonB
MSSNADLFYVKLADGDVHRVSLDQLDDAFQAGHIDASTMVLASGADRWTTLGDLAGIDDAEAAPVAVQVIPQNVSRAPSDAPPRPGRPPSVQPPRPSAQPPPPRVEPKAAQPPPWPEPPPPRVEPKAAQPPPAQWPAPGAQPIAIAQYVPAPSFRPVLPAYPASSYAQTSSLAAPRVPTSMGAVANSVRPVSVDLGQFDPDLRRSRGGSGKRWVAALMGVTLVGAAGAIAFTQPRWAQPYLSRIGLYTPSVAVAAAAPPPAPAELPPPPPAAAPPDPPQVAPPAADAPPSGDSPLNPRFTDRFTPEQKEKLAQTDKPKAKGRGKASHAAHSTSKSKSTTFTTGGSKFDPLNSSI